MSVWAGKVSLRWAIIKIPIQWYAMEMAGGPELSLSSTYYLFARRLVHTAIWLASAQVVSKAEQTPVWKGDPTKYRTRVDIASVSYSVDSKFVN
jgi:hypothetical protein